MKLGGLRDLKKPQEPAVYGATEVTSGLPVPAVTRVAGFSPQQWEEFVEEWAHSLEAEYVKVQRYGGPGDAGCDVVGFCDENRLNGRWHNFQCKFYNRPLRPTDVWVEFGKLIYYSNIGKFAPPEKYYFAAPQGLGLPLKKLLNDPAELKKQLRKNWGTCCSKEITKTQDVPLKGELEEYFDDFDFTIFDSLSVADLVEGHSKTPYHATRFGGGLPERPLAADPPQLAADEYETRYVRQILEAYSDHLKMPVDCLDKIAYRRDLVRHFHRSRETFYHAEALRNFARDTVPPGTFEALQDEVYHGVADICDDDAHEDGLKRLRATVSKAGELALTSNALCSRVRIQDKHGICHQLANEDRLVWVRSDDN